MVVYLLSTDYSSLVLDPLGNVDHLVDLYDSTLRDNIDEHEPLGTKEMSKRKHSKDYREMTIPLLKQELRLRKAKLSGKKHQLIER